MPPPVRRAPRPSPPAGRDRVSTEKCPVKREYQLVTRLSYPSAFQAGTGCVPWRGGHGSDAGARPMTTDSGRPGIARSTRMLALVAVVCVMAVVLPSGVARAAEAGRAAVVPHVYGGGGVIGFGDAQPINAPVGTSLNSVMVAMAANPASTAADQGYWLAGGRRRRVRLGRRRVLRVAGGAPAQRPDRGHGGHAGRQGLLAGRHGRRRLRLRGRRRSTARWGAPRSTNRWWAWPPRRTARATGWWPPTAASSPSATPAFYGSMGGTPLNQPVTGMAATLERPRVLAGGRRRRHLLLR